MMPQRKRARRAVEMRSGPAQGRRTEREFGGNKFRRKKKKPNASNEISYEVVEIAFSIS